MLQDYHSGYQWFFLYATKAAEIASNAIIDWCAAFGVPQGLMYNGLMHSQRMMRLVSNGLKVSHHFILPYNPWSSGAVERLGKELFQTFRATVSEFRCAMRSDLTF